MAAPTTEAKTKQPGPALWLSITVFVIGALLAGIGGFLAFNGAFEALTAESFELPGAQQRDLEPGEYDVFASTGSFTDFVGFSDVMVSDVTVTNLATNETIEVRRQNNDLTLTRQTTNYIAIGIFTVDDAGTYEIEVGSDASERAVVSRSLLDSWERVRVPLVAAGIGLILTLIGAAMLVIGIIRRARAKRSQRPPSPVWQNPGAGPPGGPMSTGPGAPSAAPLQTTPMPPPQPGPPAAPGAPGGTQTPTDSETPWG